MLLSKSWAPGARLQQKRKRGKEGEIERQVDPSWWFWGWRSLSEILTKSGKVEEKEQVESRHGKKSNKRELMRISKNMQEVRLGLNRRRERS